MGTNIRFNTTRSEIQKILESENIKLMDTCQHLLNSLYFSCTFQESPRNLILKFLSDPTLHSEIQKILESRNFKLMDTCQHLLDSLHFSCTFEESTRESNSKDSTVESSSHRYLLLDQTVTCEPSRFLIHGKMFSNILIYIAYINNVLTPPV